MLPIVPPAVATVFLAETGVKRHVPFKTSGQVPFTNRSSPRAALARISVGSGVCKPGDWVCIRRRLDRRTKRGHGTADDKSFQRPGRWGAGASSSACGIMKSPATLRPTAAASRDNTSTIGRALARTDGRPKAAARPSWNVTYGSLRGVPNRRSGYENQIWGKLPPSLHLSLDGAVPI